MKKKNVYFFLLFYRHMLSSSIIIIYKQNVRDVCIFDGENLWLCLIWGGKLSIYLHYIYTVKAINILKLMHSEICMYSYNEWVDLKTHIYWLFIWSSYKSIVGLDYIIYWSRIFLIHIHDNFEKKKYVI